MDTTQPNPETIRKQVGVRVRFLRDEMRLSRKKLGELSGVGRNQIGKIENGEPHRTGDLIFAIKRLADELHVDSEYLLVECYDKWQFQTFEELLAHQKQKLAATKDTVTLTNAVDVYARWIYFVAQFQKSLAATNFVPMDKIFNEGYAKDGRHIQARKKKEKPDLPIYKLFIATTADEFKKYNLEMNLQAEAGLSVRWHRYDTISRNNDLKDIQKSNNIDMIDFQIFDGNLVLCWDLNESNREVRGGKVFCSPERCLAHQNFFEALWMSAREYDGAKGEAQFDSE